MTKRRVVLGLVLLMWILILLGIASSKGTALDEIIAGNNITASNLIADQRPSNFNESTTCTFIKNIGNTKDVEFIKVHFKNAFRGADQNIATIDRIWQVSDTNSSQVIINDSNKVIITSGSPLMLEEGYEVAIKSIDIDGVNVNLDSSKNGECHWF